MNMDIKIDFSNPSPEDLRIGLSALKDRILNEIGVNIKGKDPRDIAIDAHQKIVEANKVLLGTTTRKEILSLVISHPDFKRSKLKRKLLKLFIAKRAISTADIIKKFKKKNKPDIKSLIKNTNAILRKLQIPYNIKIISRLKILSVVISLKSIF